MHLCSVTGQELNSNRDFLQDLVSTMKIFQNIVHLIDVMFRIL